VNDRLEIGGRLDVLYGLESSTVSSFGLGLGATIRYTLVRRENFSAEVHVFPSLRFDAFKPDVWFGLAFPIGIEGGYHLTKQATVSAGFDLGLFGDFTNGGYFAVNPMAGPGFEYHLDDHVTFGLVTRFGAATLAGDNGVDGNGIGGTAFAFRLQGFFAYRM
jgi:hypothetical protein